MKRKLILWSLLLLSPCGCSSMNNTEKGALGGAAVGTGIGALAGRGHPGAMLVGGLLGTGVGAIVGSDQDRREDRKAAVQAQAQANANAVAAVRATQMGVNDVVQLSQQGQSDSVIMGQINATNSVFQLTTNDLNYLHDQRVSDTVINYMQSRRYVVVQPRPVVIYERPYYPPPPPVYVEPGIAVGIRGRF